MLLIGLLISAAAAPSAAAPPNPLALAEKGLLQCYRPDIVKKTCQSIASYRRTGPEVYDNKAVLPIGNDATLETHTPVTVKDGAVCGTVQEEDLMAGVLRLKGSVLSAEKAKPILERIAHAFAPMTGKEICTRYEPSGADFTAKATLAGTDAPDLNVTVKWISASEGYTVSP